MALLIGTRDGLYRAASVPFDDAELVLDAGHVPRIRRFDGVDGVFATSKSGLYHSLDGETWTPLDVPTGEVWEVLAHDGDLFAGTFPARVYRRTDAGWDELEGFRDQPDAPKWRNPFGDDARVRTLEVDPSQPERLLVGLEAGGFYRSDDRGGSWTRHDVGGQDDFHQLHVLGPDEYLAVCGRLSIEDHNHGANTGGLFRTTDGGQTWTRFDDDLEHSYFRQLLVHESRLYVGGSLTIPPVWLGPLPADAALFVSDDLGETFEERSYPGGPGELILAWGVHEGAAIGGTAGGDVFGPGEPAGGRLVREEPDGEWEQVGAVPADIHSIQSF